MCLGVPGQVVAIEDAKTARGVVDVGGVRRVANLACVLDGDDPQALVGAWVLVHVGFAMSRIDAEEAARTLDLIKQLGELDDAP